MKANKLRGQKVNQAVKQTAKERPILFSGAMVLGILEGRKTQTRRIVKPLCDCPDFLCVECEDPYPFYYRRKDVVWDSFKTIEELAQKYCPYGTIGDRLWVRETFAFHPGSEGYIYRATDADWDDNETGMKWKPSIFMPRAASRIKLEVTRIDVERLQDISEADATSEGIYRMRSGFFTGAAHKVKGTPRHMPTVIAGYQDLWDSINKERGYGWDVNPWVWVVEFQKLTD